jgi:hypothetical protein
MDSGPIPPSVDQYINIYKHIKRLVIILHKNGDRHLCRLLEVRSTQFPAAGFKSIPKGF